ncbi:MAG: hypothetical protein U0105_23465 [Candidatus Obscuribacterales bacterium]
MTFPGDANISAGGENPSAYQREADAASLALSRHSQTIGFGLARFKDDPAPVDTTTLITAGTAFVGGAAITAAGQFGAQRLGEAIINQAGSELLSWVGANPTRATLQFAEPVPFLKAITPKPVLIGGTIAAALAVGAYEGYQWLKK